MSDQSQPIDPVLPPTPQSQSKHHRYVPLSNSLISDAPGYNSIKTQSSKEDERGPVCWKCKGNGINVKWTGERKRKNDNTDHNDSSTSTDGCSNDKHPTCKCCDGKGWIKPKKIKMKKNHHLAALLLSSSSSEGEGSISEDPFPTFKIHVPPKRKATLDYVNDLLTREKAHSNSAGYPKFATLQAIAIHPESRNVKRYLYDLVLNESHVLWKPPQPSASVIEAPPLPSQLLVHHQPQSSTKDTGEEEEEYNNIIQLSSLVGTYKIFQYPRGSHRFTTDDVVVGFVGGKFLHDHDSHDSHDSDTASSSDEMRLGGPVHLDLGCGNGSVLMIVGYNGRYPSTSTPTPTFTPAPPQNNSNNNARKSRILNIGIEARAQAIELSYMSCLYNFGKPNDFAGGADEFKLFRGDFRTLDELYVDVDEDNTPKRTALTKQLTDYLKLHPSTMTTTTAMKQESYYFDVITATPPYFLCDFDVVNGNDCDNNKKVGGDKVGGGEVFTKIKQGAMPTHVQSAPARCEFRGGIEAYIQTGLKVLKPLTGVMVLCVNWMNDFRVWQFCYNNHNHKSTSNRNDNGNGLLDVGGGYRVCLFDVLRVFGREGKRKPLFVVYSLRLVDSNANANAPFTHTSTDDPNNNDIERYANNIERYDDNAPAPVSVSVSGVGYTYPPETKIKDISVRDKKGKWTKEYAALLEDVGIPAWHDMV